jgi:hypothetical protein
MLRTPTLVLAFLLTTLAADARPRRADPPRRAPAHLDAAALVAARAEPLAEGIVRTRDLLLAIAEHESHFRPSIVRCQVKGDHGRAHGAYQLHPEAFGDHTADEVCANDQLQARLALVVLQKYLKAFPDLGIEGAVRGYASGRPAKDTLAAREILAMWKARRVGTRRR